MSPGSPGLVAAIATAQVLTQIGAFGLLRLLRSRGRNCTSRNIVVQKLTPFLWFDDQAEAAVAFYCAGFRNAVAGAVGRYAEGTPGRAGGVMTASFTLRGWRSPR